jgi:hypothetical protein
MFRAGGWLLGFCSRVGFRSGVVLDSELVDDYWNPVWD